MRRFQHFPLLLFLAIVVFGIALRMHFFSPGISRTPDERTYTRQANVLLAQGTAGFRFLDREFADNPAGVVACCTAVAVLVDVTVLATLFGSLNRYLTLERAFLHFSAINPYDMQFAAGPAWMYPAALFRVCPVVVLGALTGFAVTLRRALRARALADAGLPVGIALLCLLMMLLPLVAGRYNFRYGAPAYGPICLLAGIGIAAILPMLCTVLAPLGRSVAWAILGFAIAVAALRDLDTARDSFLVPEIQDLALRAVYGVPPLPLSSGLTLDVSAQSGGQTESAPAIEQEEEIVREHPTEDNRVNLSLAYIRAQEPGRAVSLLSALVAEDGSDVRAWNNLCVADTMQMRYNLGIAACQRALRLAPDFELARNNLKWAQDENRKAIAAVSAQEQIAPGSRNAASYLAEGLNDLHIGNYDRAIEAWQQVLRLDPANALAANNIGTAYMLRQQPELAVPWFQRAIAGDPNLQIASNNLAWAHDELAKVGR